MRKSAVLFRTDLYLGFPMRSPLDPEDLADLRQLGVDLGVEPRALGAVAPDELIGRQDLLLVVREAALVEVELEVLQLLGGDLFAFGLPSTSISARFPHHSTTGSKCAHEVRDGDPAVSRSVEGIARDCAETLPRLFPEHPNAAAYTGELILRACDLARSGSPDPDCIAQIGRGWVGEEALAIAVFSAVRHAGDFGAAIRSAANHSSDSDSTASICGNIVGAAAGLSAIGEEWTRDLELRDVILEVARDLCDDCPMEEWEPYRDERWLSKYAEGDKLKRRRKA